MIVCLCECVSDKQIRQVIESGASSLQEVTQSCGAGGGCGGCHCSIEGMLQTTERASDSGSYSGPSNGCLPLASGSALA